MHHIATQTVLDKYCRQLSLTAYQFDRLLEQPNLSDLKALLSNKFNEHQTTIEEYVE
jgi:hypothetical protein